jgi:hypothetical protein
MNIVLKMLISEAIKWLVTKFLNFKSLLKYGLCIVRGKILQTKTKIDDHVFNALHDKGVEDGIDFDCKKIDIKVSQS